MYFIIICTVNSVSILWWTMSDFTSLEELGLSESALKNIATGTSCQSLPPSLYNAPSHGVLLGLLVFAKTYAKS